MSLVTQPRTDAGHGKGGVGGEANGKPADVAGKVPVDVESSPLLRVGVSALGIGLVQTDYFFGFNSSGADALAVALLAVMATRSLRIPLAPAVFFLVVGVTATFTAAFVTPEIFGVSPHFRDVVNGLVKLTVTFGYLVLGFNLARLAGSERLLRFFSWSALVVGSLGAFLTLIDLDRTNQFLFLDGARFRGFTSDPNLWGILLCAAVPYFMRPGRLALPLRAALSAAVLLGVLATGSKTGTIIWLAYTLYLVLRGVVLQVKAQRFPLFFVVSLICLLLLIPFKPPAEDASAFVTKYVPVAERITALFEDPDGALEAEGSSRTRAFDSAFLMIERSPFVGVGIGPYLAVGLALTGNYVLAHNTFLQLAAEWGVPLVAALIVGIGLLLIRRPRAPDVSGFVRAQKEMLVILLIGSMSISLNNVRLMWLLIGSLISAGFYLDRRDSVAAGAAGHAMAEAHMDERGGSGA